ncbi:MAG TPA: ATP-binding protein [Gemmataceae bacterium]|nr:ATP-binding protein [Gemmataceae bacterium]
MAGRWRFRHKLMLGLGLVVGILVLLLAGTLKGLASYRATMSSMDSKLLELKEAQNLKVVMTDLAAPPNHERCNPAEEIAELRAKLQNARNALEAYQQKLQATLQLRRDLDRGLREQQQVEALQQLFAELGQAITEAEVPQVHHGAPPSPRRHEKVDRVITRLVHTSNDLQDVIYDDLYHRITTAKSDYRKAMWLVVSTTVVGVVLMVGLLRFFYAWIFYPIRDLERGVGRVAQGDFEHHIEVHSGDEIEDLAEAFNDMTRRLRDMYTDLAHQVNERSRQLVRSERLASVGFLAAGVAHEINNPLASIAFCAEALEARLFRKEEGGRTKEEGPTRGGSGIHPSSFILHPSEREVVAKYLRMIQEEAFRCKKITERLLEFSRPGERHREPADLVEIVQSVLDMLQHHQSCKGKQVVFKPLGRVIARVNVQEIKSVVLNLVVNALDSMEDGGTLTIRVRQRDGMAEMEFADTGCGMTPEVLENIFEPFFTRSRTGKGTGLGLTISHRIVSQHGGEIEAASPGPGQGSTFTVRLPLQPAEAAADEPPARMVA